MGSWQRAVWTMDYMHTLSMVLAPLITMQTVLEFHYVALHADDKEDVFGETTN